MEKVATSIKCDHKSENISKEFNKEYRWYKQGRKRRWNNTNLQVLIEYSKVKKISSL